MTIASEITRIKTAIADAYIACQDMGATIPAILNSDNLEQCIASISGGGSSATVLHLYDRVDGKATVVGFWTDGNGQRYAVCVADAAYRSAGSADTVWSKEEIDTVLPNYLQASEVKESGTYNTNTILNTYSSLMYTSFNIAKNACTITIDNKTFESCLPNILELQMIWNDRVNLDTYDITLSNYPSNSLTTWNFGSASQYSCWSSNEFDTTQAFRIQSNGVLGLYRKNYGGYSRYGICPIIEIPVDENGEVQ